MSSGSNTVNSTSSFVGQVANERSFESYFGIANLFPKHTGLPFVVWIGGGGGARHDIRVRVSPTPEARTSKMASVALRPSVHVVDGEVDADKLRSLEKWVNLNFEVLLRYWEGEIDTKDALDALQPVAAKSFPDRF